MFEFSLEGGSALSAYYNDCNELKFSPPVYEQRYCITTRILEHDLFEGKIKKVIDFGCAELKLLEQLKRIPQIELILEVDIDEENLLLYSQRAKPLVSDYLNRRKFPLRIEICKGSIDASAEAFRDADAVIGLEIIEHVYPDVLNSIPYNIFGYIRPKLTIFSTPNSEYNVFFKLDLPNGFRHHDHKFEWSRQQFQDWCFNICTRFPNYQVSFLGVGESPPQLDDMGFVTQVAVFIRNDIRNLALIDDINVQPEKLHQDDDVQILCSSEFPVLYDDRSFEQKLLDDIKYQIYRNKQMKRYNEECDRYEIPIQEIFNLLFPSVTSVDELKQFLKFNQYTIDGKDMIIVDNNYSDDQSTDSSELNVDNNPCDSIKETKLTDDDEVWD